MIKNYRFQPSVTTVIIFFIVVVSIIATVDFIRDEASSFNWKHFSVTALSISAALFVSSGLYSFSTSQLAGFMPWYLTVSKSGFLICNIKNLQDRANPVILPEGYSNDILAGFVNPQEGSEPVPDSTSSKEYPDIILILNESFCDLNVCCPIYSDVDCMSAFYDIDGAVYGHAVIPDIGGGTNNSEFELLTSKSMYLLNSPAPFTYLSPEQLSRSIVQYLNLLGYETSALHCEPAQNYSRNTAYPAMGFKNILLGPEMFSLFNRNGNRPWLDSDNYKDLIEYCKNKEGAPQFLYLLTFQNHGGYEQNPPELDTVHSSLTLGRVTEEINEYLSSIKLSAESFREMTEYFKNSQRHTIICMVGDHAPSFVTRLPDGNGIIENSSINMRMVPYVIWSNFSMEASFYSEYASLTDLVPMILKTADLPLTSFYSYILQLHEIYPIRTSDGLYVNRSFDIKMYDPDSSDDMLKTYYFLEYNSLLPKENYFESLFGTR